MSGKTKVGTSAPAPPGSSVRRAEQVAVCLVMAFAVLLGVRRMDNEDLGYHLAFGDYFLRTGHIMDRSDFLYTIDEPASFPPGPGGYYDSQGHFRFASANWLTQVVMSALHHVGGMAGLCLLQAALVAGVFVLVYLILRRLGAPPLWRAAAILLLALVSYERFNLRPELFTYVLMIGQLYLLLPDARGKLQLAWPKVAGLIVLQLLLVNVHSYFLLGLMMTGAVLGDQVVRALYHRLRKTPQEGQPLPGRNIRLLAVALAGQVVMCLVNPWTWRLAALPFETLVFFEKNHITSPSPGQPEHPLSVIGEFYPPLLSGAFPARTTYAYFVLLVVSGVGAFCALLLRRWGWAGLIAVMAAMSLSMRRNIAPAAMVILPLAAPCLYLILRRPAAFLSPRWQARAGLACALVLAVAGGVLAVSVLSNGFYYSERRPTRFGLGLSRLKVPVAAAEWINRNRPAGNLWCDFNSSSNLYYLTGRDVPIITNSWAFPPEVMHLLLEYCRGQRPFAEEVRRHNVTVVVLRVDQSSEPLARRLCLDPAWAVVNLDAYHVVFLRRDGANAELARRFAIDPRTFDVAAYKKSLAALDPRAAYAFHVAGVCLNRLASAEPPETIAVTAPAAPGEPPAAAAQAIAWDTLAIRLLRAATEEDPDYHETWNCLGICHARRGTRRMIAADFPGEEDWHEAVRCFQKALALGGDDSPRQNLKLVSDQIASLKRGVILKPKW